MKKFIISLFIIFSVLSLTGCNEREKYAVKILRDNHEAAQAGLSGKVDPVEVLTTISGSSDTAANKLDPNRMVQPDTTATAIIEAAQTTPPGQPNPELKKIGDAAAKGPASSGFGSLGWGGIAGAALLLVGGVGKFLGPPWNIAGSMLQGVASRMLPNYSRDKAAAVGAIVSTDKMLTDYGSLLDAMPEVKAKLKDKLGGADPVQWMKDKLNSAQQDLGTASQVSALMDVLKQEMTTKDGVLTPTTEEIDSILSKHI